MKDDIKKSLAKAIKYYAEREGVVNKSGEVNQSELARRTKNKGFPVDQTTIGRILSESGSDVTVSTIQALARALRVTPADLTSASIHQNTAPVLPYIYTVPLIDFSEAGFWAEAHNVPQSSIGETVPVYGTKVSENSFALKVMGESMMPEYKEGDILIIDPEALIKPGDLVIAKLDQEETATFKRYKPRGKDTNQNEIIELAPINENYPSLRIDANNPGQIIGKVIARFETY